MPKVAWKGSGGPIEELRVGLATGQIRRVARPAHPYGSPAADLKKEQAEEEARARAAALAAESDGAE